MKCENNYALCPVEKSASLGELILLSVAFYSLTMLSTNY